MTLFFGPSVFQPRTGLEAVKRYRLVGSFGSRSVFLGKNALIRDVKRSYPVGTFLVNLRFDKKQGSLTKNGGEHSMESGRI